MNRPDLFRFSAPLLERPCAPLTDEQFNLFHSLDRELYARLALSLRRELFVSVKVVAFWIWLERESHDMRLMRRISFLQPAELNKLADETVTCLECLVCKNGFLLGNHDISLLPNLLSFWFRLMFSLRSLHERRVEIIMEVDSIIDTICFRAFRDIMQQVSDENATMQAVAAAAQGGGISLKEGNGIGGHPPKLAATAIGAAILSGVILCFS
ncbi:uncharacterized protein [Primulina eburnea]|uniref:uncharacterized protein n=1 Tax=Primulina eburnea TaxID=1245227 RepID=UPI003C6C1188